MAAWKYPHAKRLKGLEDSEPPAEEGAGPELLLDNTTLKGAAWKKLLTPMFKEGRCELGDQREGLFAAPGMFVGRSRTARRTAIGPGDRMMLPSGNGCGTLLRYATALAIVACTFS